MENPFTFEPIEHKGRAPSYDDWQFADARHPDKAVLVTHWRKGMHIDMAGEFTFYVMDRKTEIVEKQATMYLTAEDKDILRAMIRLRGKPA